FVILISLAIMAESNDQSSKNKSIEKKSDSENISVGPSHGHSLLAPIDPNVTLLFELNSKYILRVTYVSADENDRGRSLLRALKKVYDLDNKIKFCRHVKFNRTLEQKKDQPGSG